ncbi:hypothetical protein SAMN04488540_10217 [Ferrimonas sediminum]|uniref:Uncharacterized protein n=2 Tax=Ferrimonas sediminum TaxID=718193 RepID=A0A1G8LC36_9GAMM|nr:hypothetical protein SAMN04488540_10217 [Ferrimonas sediminum]
MPVCLGFPVDDGRITALSDEEMGRQEGDSIVLSSACWRNYIATWEISEGRLYLIGLEGKYRLSAPEPILADWFSGEFTLPQGELIDCNVELDFTLRYTQEVSLRFQSGVVVESILKEVQ